jgi:hypothetical protein
MELEKDSLVLITLVQAKTASMSECRPKELVFQRIDV